MQIIRVYTEEIAIIKKKIINSNKILVVMSPLHDSDSRNSLRQMIKIKKSLILIGLRY